MQLKTGKEAIKQSGKEAGNEAGKLRGGWLVLLAIEATRALQNQSAWVAVGVLDLAQFAG